MKLHILGICGTFMGGIAALARELGHEVEGSDNLLHACLSLGLNIPYFCWHPALGSVGAGRFA